MHQESGTALDTLKVAHMVTILGFGGCNDKQKLPMGFPPEGVSAFPTSAVSGQGSDRRLAKA